MDKVPLASHKCPFLIQFSDFFEILLEYIFCGVDYEYLKTDIFYEFLNFISGIKNTKF